MRCVTLALLAALTFTGCAAVPKPAGYDFTTQRHMQAAQHWQFLADEVAASTLLALGAPTVVSLHGDERTAFGSAFRGFLTTALVARGISVAATEAPVRLVWTTQPVVHAARRLDRPVPVGWLFAPVVAVTVAPFVDTHNIYTYGAVPHTEIIVTTAVSNATDGAVRLRRSDVFYVNAVDLPHYAVLPRDALRPIPPRTMWPALHEIGLRLDDRWAPPTIGAVVSGSHAEQVGLRAGDVLVGMDGMIISVAVDVVTVLRTKRYGDTLAIRVNRNGEPVAFLATLAGH